MSMSITSKQGKCFASFQGVNSFFREECLFRAKGPWNPEKWDAPFSNIGINLSGFSLRTRTWGATVSQENYLLTFGTRENSKALSVDTLFTQGINLMMV